MRWAAIALVTVLCLLRPSPTWAQNGDAADRDDLARRLIDATARDVLQKSMIDAIQRQAASLDNLTDEQRDWYAANALPILDPHLQVMIDDMQTRYAELFTEAELTTLVTLYETPEGRIIAEKQATIGVVLGEQMHPMAQAYVTDLLEKFCARFDCLAGGDPQTGLKLD